MTQKPLLVIGVGYVGLVSAVCLADLGHHIICLDIDNKKIEMLLQGEMPIYEPGIDTLLKKNIDNGRLTFTSSYEEAFQKDLFAILIAVDTPTYEGGYCDLSRIEKVLDTVVDYITDQTTLIIKSTVPIGTNQKMLDRLRSKIKNKAIQIELISNPEFLREGAALHDFMYADRVIIGVRSERAEEIMRSIYAPLFYISPKTKLLVMDPESSELTKYAANSMLAVRISFMNWLARIAEKGGANIDAVREGIGSDPRIGPSFLQAGLGFGGSCFPKDIRALKRTSIDMGIPPDILTAIDTINFSQRKFFTDKVIAYIDTFEIESPHIGIWGLSFKPNTDDMRDAPSIDIISQLVQRGIKVSLFDPIAITTSQKIITKEPWYDKNLISWVDSPLEAALDVDALLLVTEWDIFRNVDLKELKTRMKQPVIFDGRNLFRPEIMKTHGFFYSSIGRRGNEPLEEEPESASCLKKQPNRI